MRLINDKEIELFHKLGFEVDDNGNIIKKEEKISFEDMDYAGFNMYITEDNRVFEKRGEELIEVTSEELDAERRFLEKHLK